MVLLVVVVETYLHGRQDVAQLGHLGRRLRLLLRELPQHRSAGREEATSEVGGQEEARGTGARQLHLPSAPQSSQAWMSDRATGMHAYLSRPSAHRLELGERLVGAVLDQPA